MSKINTKLPPELDRRKKLTEDQKECIKSLVGESVSALARYYNVSCRTINFIQHPERRLKNTEDGKANGGWRKYYTTASGTAAMAKTREYKKQLKKEGKL